MQGAAASVRNTSMDFLQPQPPLTELPWLQSTACLSAGSARRGLRPRPSRGRVRDNSPRAWLRNHGEDHAPAVNGRVASLYICRRCEPSTSEWAVQMRVGRVRAWQKRTGAVRPRVSTRSASREGLNRRTKTPSAGSFRRSPAVEFAIPVGCAASLRLTSATGPVTWIRARMTDPASIRPMGPGAIPPRRPGRAGSHPLSCLSTREKPRWIQRSPCLWEGGWVWTFLRSQRRWLPRMRQATDENR